MRIGSWDLIQPLWYTVSIYDSLEVYNQDLSSFTEGQRKIFALSWYNAEVCNGGHDQFFSNSTGIVWKDALEGMNLIGATELFENFQKAIDKFGGVVPFGRQERMQLLDTLWEDENFDDISELDNFYYDHNDVLESLMMEYIKNNASEFVVDGDFDYYE